MRVDITNRGWGRKVSSRKVKETARRILEFLKQDRAELSLALVGNREIRDLNVRYRNKTEPTDVLSFPLGSHILPGVRLLGDVVISVEQAEEQARKRRKTLDQEVKTLLIHGILHLLGYDHERSKKDAKIMRGMEKRIHRALCDKGRLGV